MAIIERIIALTPINEEARVVWHGINSHIEHRTQYKALNVKMDVPDNETEKWLAVLACVALSASLNVWLVGLVFGPVTWLIVVEAIVASAMVCLGVITPEVFGKQNGSAEVIHHDGDWHPV